MSAEGQGKRLQEADCRADIHIVDLYEYLLNRLLASGRRKKSKRTLLDVQDGIFAACRNAYGMGSANVSVLSTVILL